MATTEREVLSLMRGTLTRAAERLDLLLAKPKMGATFRQFRADLKTIETCCRQVAFFRDDARWLQIGLQIEMTHQKAGHWVRTHQRLLLHKLADNLRGIGYAAQGLETAATGRTGMILPVPGRTDRTNGRPMQVVLPGERQTAGGIIVPEGVAA